MDPLSITASVTGLLTAVASVAMTVRSIVTRMKDVPREMHALLAEVDELHTAIASLSDFIRRASQLPKNRKGLISVDQLVATLTEAVLTISEIDFLLKPLKINNFSRNISLRDKVHVTFNQSTMITIIQRLQRNKASLNLMFNIVQCESDKEAATSHVELKTLVERMVDANQDLCRRLDALEAGSIIQSCACSVRTTDNDQEDVETIRPLDEKDSAQALDSPESHQFRFAFENILEASRVYRKAHPNECDMSLRSSVARSHAWSSLSDLSLAQVSIVSVIALPLYPSDLTNSEWYTFGDITEVNTPSSDQPQPDSALRHKGTSSEESSTMANSPDEAVPKKSALATIKYSIDGDSSDNEDDYPCKCCGEILETNKAFELAGHRWHVDCFRCATCQTQLDSDADLLLLGDGTLVCNNCTYSCSACGEKIEDLAILTGDQAYCAGCFKCRNCKRQIENLRYARTTQGMSCMDCHDALMARRRRKQKQKTTVANHREAIDPSNYSPTLKSQLRASGDESRGRRRRSEVLGEDIDLQIA